MKKLLLIGGGGHCHSVIDTALATNEFDELGIVDDIDSSCLGIPVIGNDNDLPALIRQGWNCAVIAVGSVGDTRIRKHLYNLIRNLSIDLPTIIDPTAIVANETVIGKGCFIGKKSVINTGACLGECCIINTGAIVEHDCILGSFVHVSPGAVLCGQVNVGMGSHVGAGSVIRQGAIIGDNTIIGAGSVVVSSIPSGTIAYGNPCRVVD